MRKNKRFVEAMENVPEIDNMNGAVPVVMADAKEVSDARKERVELMMKKHRKETGAEENKPFTGTKGKNMEGKKNTELNKLDLNEELFEAYGVRETSDKLLDLVDGGAIDKDFLINALVKYLSEDEVKDFCEMNEIFIDDEEDLDESINEAVGKIRAGSIESTKVFIDSVDEPDNFVAVKVTTAFTADGDFNSHMFDDGAPVLKCFYRGKTSFVQNVEIPKNSWLVVSPYYEDVYRFNGKGWILLQDSLSDITEFITSNYKDIIDYDDPLLETVKTDLSNKKGSMTQVLTDATAKLNACSSVSELHNAIKELFAANNINTVASNRLLNNIEKSKSLTDAQFKLYNSILAGSKLSVNETLLDDDDNEYDMHTFISDLFTRSGERYSNVERPMKLRRFDYNARDLDNEDINDLSFAVSSTRDGDIVLSAEKEEKFDKAKQMCDHFGLDYEIKPPRAATRSPYGWDMIIWVPFDEQGNVLSVERYFKEYAPELGIDPAEIIKGQGRVRYKKKK